MSAWVSHWRSNHARLSIRAKTDWDYSMNTSTTEKIAFKVGTINLLDRINQPHPILLIPSNDTHARWMIPLAKKLPDYAFMIIPNRKEGAPENLKQNGESMYTYQEGVLKWIAPSVVVLANDWGREEYEIIQEARLLGIPTVCIQEGSVFFPVMTGRVLQNADYIFAAGYKTPDYLKRKNILLTGSPKYDSITTLPLPSKPMVMINCNFTYGIFENIRLQWLEDVTGVCEKLGLDYFISQHPRDPANLPGRWRVVRSAEAPFLEQMKAATILVSRFSTLLYEALMAGREVIYYDPHGENPDLFSPDEEGIYWAKDVDDLKARLHEALETNGARQAASQQFLEKYCGPVDQRASVRCAQALVEIAQSYLINQSKLVDILNRTDSYYCNSQLLEAVDAFTEGLEYIPSEPTLLIARGNIHLLSGNLSKAHRDFVAASVLNPDYLVAKVHLANSYLLLGDVSKARQQLEVIAARNPDFPDLDTLNQLILHPPTPLDKDEGDIWQLPSVKAILAENPLFKDEIAFWHRELSLQGEFETDILNRSLPERQHRVFPIQLLPYLEKLWKESGQKPRVLDVGSGPLSMLSWGVTHNLIDLLAVDPLAEVYLDFLNMYHYHRYHPLLRLAGEQLRTHFGANCFDLVWIRNALDHCQDPPVVFRQMVEILRPGGYLYFSGFGREATFENWRGLHNFDLYFYAEGRLMCASKAQEGFNEIDQNELTQGLPLQLIESSIPIQEPRAWMYAIWKKSN